ncbi:hypothetical protein [Acinetobacter bereziniae]|uniref:hypothetical protein n=1 Tax=Acinetobacter bereziniae TaxID=106648 RepID=UPI00208FD671|nr:hypothetical protein [Acinetobacter bereziniae]
MAQLTADQLVQLARQGKGKSPVDLGQSSTTIGVDGEQIPKKSTQLTADQLVAMAKKQVRYKPFIEAQRKSGKSDINIFNAMLDIPEFKADFEQKNNLGYKNRQIAQELGLNIPNPHAVDWEKEQREAMFAEAKKAGKTQAWESSLLGLTNLGATAAQAFYKASDLLDTGINKITGTNYLPTNRYEQYTKQRKGEENFHQLRREQNNQGFDWWKLAGELANPLAAYGKGYQGAKILSSEGAKITGQNALLGMGIGGTSFAEDSGDRLSNSIAGGIGGAAGGIVAQKIGQGVSKVVDKSTQLGKNVSAKFSQEKTQKLLQSIDEKLEAALRPEGISLNDLSQTIVNSLRDDAIKAVQSGKNLNPTAVARKVVLDRLGLKGTRAQVSGDAAQWQKESELSKIQDVGQPLRDKFIDDNAQLTRLLSEAEQSTGGKSFDNYGVLSDAIKSLDDQLSQNKSYINEIYNTAKQASGNDISLDGRGFANDAITALEKDYAMSSLPSSIHKLIKDISKNPQGFTLGKSEELIKILNREYTSSLQNGQPTSSTHAIGVVRNALNGRQNEAMQGLLTQGGNDAAQFYQLGRQAHKFNIEQIQSMPLLEDAVKGVEPDKLFNKHILGGNIAELDKTIQLLKNVNPQVVNDIKQQVVQFISKEAINSNGQLSPAGMKKALDKITDRRLLTMFTPKELSHLKDIRSAMDYLITQPPHSYVNNSNSGSSLTNHFLKFLKLPGVNHIPFAKVFTGVDDGMGVSKAMTPSIAGEATPSIISQDLIDRLVKAGIISGSNLPNQ